MSMEVFLPLTSCFASVTYGLPGPKILSTLGTLSVPKAIAATAWAPPMRKMRVIPHSRSARRTSGATEPSLRQGVQRMRSRQPARAAGTASISTVENRGALPPGMYRPTRRIGTGRWMQTTPGAVSTRISRGIWAPWKASMFFLAARIASRTGSATSLQAASTSAAVTSRGASTPSMSFIRRLMAASPSVSTALRMASTRGRMPS